MKTFKYETHLHTSEGSKCAVTKAVDYIKSYKKLGYSGIFITNHFFNGNTTVPKDLPWKERIEKFCEGYNLALEATKNDDDFNVFLGLEQTFNNDDYLVYGFDKNYLKEHPEIENMNQQELFLEVEKVGGLMIQAHPFRLRSHLNAIDLHPLEVHGVEVFNGHNTINENEMAAFYAKNFGCLMSSGSDIHDVNHILEIPESIGGVEFETPIYDVNDFCKRMKARQYALVNNEKLKPIINVLKFFKTNLTN